MGAARVAVACLAATWLVACGLDVNGLEATSSDGGVTGYDATADVTTADASQETSSGADTGSDTGAMPDVAMPETGLVDGCVPTGAESCTNGLDDDCNGLIDCADPACKTQGYACITPSPKPGWDFVAFDATSQPGCPATLTPKNVDVDPTNPVPPAMCACTCAASGTPSCETGNISWTHGPMNTCATGGPTNSPANNGNCNTASVTVDAFMQVTGPPATGGTCTATVTPTLPPNGATKGEVCGGETVFGAGCAAPQVCGLVPAGFTACIHHGGANMMCPAGAYTTSHAVGTLMDNRGCGNCTCGPPTTTCLPGSWDFYGSGDCTGAVGLVLSATGQCIQAQAPGTYQSNKFSSSVGSSSCGLPTMAPPPTGNVTLMGGDTICCP